MRAGATAVLSLVVLAPVVGAQRGDPREQHAFATVTDKKGAAVAGLGVADFSVKEDGVKREVLRVEPAAAPLQVVLLLDSSDAVKEATHDIRLGATAFINAIFDANSLSQMALYTFGERPTPVAPFAATPIPILKAAADFFPAQGSGAYFNEGVRDASRALAKIDAKRPVIVAFVDENGPEFSNIDHTRVATELQQSRAALWTISRPDRNAANNGLGNPTDNTARLERSTIINDLTSQSGGQNTQVFTTTTLATTFSDVAKLLASQYDITYARPESMIPPKRIEVATSKSGTKLLAPHWGGK
jgi:hypothetical protein